MYLFTQIEERVNKGRSLSQFYGHGNYGDVSALFDLDSMFRWECMEHERWLDSGGAEGQRMSIEGADLADLRVRGGRAREPLAFSDLELWNMDVVGTPIKALSTLDS